MTGNLFNIVRFFHAISLRAIVRVSNERDYFFFKLSPTREAVETLAATLTITEDMASDGGVLTAARFQWLIGKGRQGNGGGG